MYTCPTCGSDVSEAIDRIILVEDRRHIIVNGTLIKLSRSEFDVFDLLYSKYPRIVTYNQMLIGLYGGHEPDYSEQSLRVFIYRSRKKIHQAEVGMRIKNVAGIGYRLLIESPPDDEV